MFGSSSREFILKVVTEYKDATKGLDQVGESTRTLGDKTKNLAKVVGGALVVGEVVRFGKSAVEAASNLEQAGGAVDSTFGDMADSIKNFGESSAENLGISNAEFQQMSSLMGSLMKNAGVPMDQVAESTLVLSERAADLAATFGGTAPDAMAAMTSALKGEMDPLEAFGVSLKASDIEARAMAMGYVDAAGEVTAAGKAIAAQEIILEQSADKAGTFAAESGTLAGQTQIMQAQFTDLSATLGQQLLPLVVQVAGWFQTLVTFIQDNISWLAPLAVTIGTIVVALKAWTIAQAAFNLVMAANPIMLVVVALAGLTAGLVMAYKKSETFRNIVDALGRTVKEVFQSIWDIMRTTVRIVSDIAFKLFEIYTWPYRKAWEVIKVLLDKIPEAARWVYDRVRYYFGLVKTAMTSPIDTAVRTVKGYLTGLRDTYQWLWDKTKWFFTQIGKAISYPIEAAFRGVKNAWNSSVGKLSFKVPSWVPGIGGKGWSMPKLAAGGVVTRPTVALIGEAGPEAVIPLSKMGGMGTVINVNVYALAPTAETGRLIARSIEQYQRVKG